VRTLLTATCVLSVASPAVVLAAQANCGRYESHVGLPARFAEIARGSLGEVEMIVLSDGRCTCENGPAVDRFFGRAPPRGLNWSCRRASAEERRSN
jgi:hypothetical protein